MLTKQIARLTLLAFAVSIILRDVPPALALTASGGGRPASPVTEQQPVVDERYGRILEGSYAGNERLVVYVQDVHCNGGVQRNISKIIQSIDRAQKINRVYIEGAPCGQVDVSLLANFPDGSLKREALSRMMGKGLLTGAEYYALTTGTDKLFGIEDKEVYDGNLQRLRILIKNQKRNRALARKISGEVTGLKRRYLSSELYRLDRQAAAGTSRKKLDHFCAGLALRAERAGEDLSRYPDFNRYMRMIALGRDIRGTRDHAAIEKYFEELQALKAAFNPQNFLFEQQSLAAAVLARSARRPFDQDLLFLSRMSRIFSDMVELKVTSKDFAYFKDHDRHFYLLLAKFCGFDLSCGALGILRNQELMRYYTLNIQRNEIFAHALLGKEPAPAGRAPATAGGSAAEVLSHLKDFKQVDVVIAGGFHDGLVKRLRHSASSFLTVMPVVDAVKPADDDLYKGIITGAVDVKKVVEAAFQDPVGDLALVEEDSFAGKFFIDLLILIQSGKHLKMSNIEILAKISEWKMREGEDHPLTAVDVHNGRHENEWVLKLAGVEIVRAEIKDDGTAITDVKYYGHHADPAHPAVTAREAWERQVVEIIGSAIADLVPAFIIRNSGIIEGFAMEARQSKEGFDQTLEEYLQSLSMEKIRAHVAAGREVVFVMGHDKPDNDALYAAIIKAYLMSQYAGPDGTLFVPLMCVVDPDYKLTDEQGLETVTMEAVLASKVLGLDLSWMIQSRHVAHWLKGLTEAQITEQMGIILVDMQKFPNGCGLTQLPVKGIDDHHPAFTDESADLSDGIQIHPVGATISIIVRWARSIGIRMPGDVARMAVSGIGDDTKGWCSAITQWIDAYNAHALARAASVDPLGLYAQQNEIHVPPTAVEVLSDRKDSYHASILIGQHNVRKVTGTSHDYFGVENESALREDIFAAMERLRVAGNADGRPYNAFIHMMTCLKTQETRLWIVINDEERSHMAVMEIVDVLQQHYPGAALKSVPAGKDGARRYEITGLVGLTARKEMAPLIEWDKYWPVVQKAIDEADEIIVWESINFFIRLFGELKGKMLRKVNHWGALARQMELVVDDSRDEAEMHQRRKVLNSWRLVAAPDDEKREKRDVDVCVPLGKDNGEALVGLAINAKGHTLAYWLIEAPSGYDYNSEEFRFRVAAAFANEISGRGSAPAFIGVDEPVRIAHSKQFVPPSDVSLLDVPVGPVPSMKDIVRTAETIEDRILSTISPDTMMVDPDAIDIMQSAA